VDVTGAHPAVEVTSRSGLVARTMTIVDIARLESHHGWAHPDPDAADPWVLEVLARTDHGPKRPLLMRPALRLEMQIDPQIDLRFDWSGANELNVYVRHGTRRRFACPAPAGEVRTGLSLPRSGCRGGRDHGTREQVWGQFHRLSPGRRRGVAAPPESPSRIPPPSLRSHSKRSVIDRV
jgi:hypothetical protein